MAPPAEAWLRKRPDERCGLISVGRAGKHHDVSHIAQRPFQS
jgi:hypothetical protein